MWSLKYKHCRECGTTEKRHLGRGLCELCYQKSIEKRYSRQKVKKGFSTSLLSRDYLVEHYLNNKESLSDIASTAKCSRQFVLKKIKEFNVPLREKSQARELALKKGKIKFNRTNEAGESEYITLNKNKVNHHFFSSWTPQMAYVLGIVCTDGNIRPSILKVANNKDTLRISRLTISQKEPELLKKVLRLMNSETKLLHRNRKDFSKTVSGETYYFHLNSDLIYDDLVKLGITPNKSLTLKFPDVPVEYVHHFIRGCWDGDGSVYFDNTSNSVFASFISGSVDFITGILSHLTKSGLPERTLHKSGNSYYFRYTGKQCKLLAEYLYRNADESMWLNRKYEIFKSLL
jgi:predicted DNA-binding protein YlxM (UPF0122 family)